MGNNTFHIICLVSIISLNIICNTCALVFLYRIIRKPSLKDKLTATLCTFNLLQVVSYTIELISYVRNRVSPDTCHIEAFMICFCTYASIGYFVALIFDRHFSIIYPYKVTSKMIVRLSFMVPVFNGLVFSAAPLLGWGRYGVSKPNNLYCTFTFRNRTTSDDAFFFTTIVCTFMIPTILTTIFFVRIIIELRRTVSKIRRKYGRHSELSRDSQKSVLDNVLSSIMTSWVYFASWIPYACVCFYQFQQKEVAEKFETFALYMSKSSTITSALIFCLVEKRVRRFIKASFPLNSLALQALGPASLGFVRNGTSRIVLETLSPTEDPD